MDNNKVFLEFVGNNANGVTGSCIYAKFYDKDLKRDYQFLLECGMQQIDDKIECYKNNNDMLNRIDFKSIDSIISFDNHADHSLLIPASIKRGFNGDIYTTYGKKYIEPYLWEDGLGINKTDVGLLISKGIKAKTYYDKKHYECAKEKQVILDFEKEYKLSPNITFTMLYNMHNYDSSSGYFTFRDISNNLHKLYYSSDLGNIKFKKYFINHKQEPLNNSNVCIYESTYSARDRSNVPSNLRDIEYEKTKDFLMKILLKNKGVIVSPCFAFDRSPNVGLFYKDIIDNTNELKDIDVYMVGKLTNNLLNCFNTICQDENKSKIEELLQWENLKRISCYKDIKNILNDKIPKIIISSGGFGDCGMVVDFLKANISNDKNGVIFTGYSSYNSVSSQIKRKEEFIKFQDLSKVSMKCNKLELHSFSSHIQRDDLIKFIISTNQDKCVLVHGDSRNELAEDLKVEFKKLNKTTKVIVPSIKDTLYF